MVAPLFGDLSLCVKKVKKQNVLRFQVVPSKQIWSVVSEQNHRNELLSVRQERRTCAKIGLRMKLALAAHPPALLPHQIKSQILHCNVSQLFCSSLPLHIKELPHLRPHICLKLDCVYKWKQNKLAKLRSRYILQKYSWDKYTSERAFKPSYTFLTFKPSYTFLST